MQAIATIGLDIAKSVFQVHGIDAQGQVAIRRQLKRRYVLAFFQKLPARLVGIEACASSHHWSRELQALRSMGVNCANRSLARATEHFPVTGPVRGQFARLGPVEALARAVLGLFARPVLGDLVRAGEAGPVPAHLPWPPKLGID